MPEPSPDRLDLERLGLADQRWSAFLASVPDSSPFHLPAWAETLSECYGFEPFVISFRGPSGEIVAGMPALQVKRPRRRPRWVSLPFTDYCPPLLRASVDVRHVVSNLDQARREAGVSRVEVRAELPGTTAQSCTPSWAHRIDLKPGKDAVFASFHPSQVQRNIRRAERERVSVRVATDESDLIDDFYRLHVLTRRRLGVPVQPRRYFRVLWRRMLAEGHGFVMVASIAERPVAGAVFLTSASTVVYKYGASDPACRGSRATHLLFWEAIRQSCENGYASFDFGRTDIQDESLRAFKSRWGTSESLQHYSVIGAPTAADGRGVPPLARAALRRAPLLLTRVTGELLYRYTA